MSDCLGLYSCGGDCMKRYIIHNDSDIFAMSNVRGRYVVNPRSLPFSFYFYSGEGVTHGIRVKPSFNPEKLKYSMTGTLKLCDDWSFTPGKEDKNVKNKDIESMKEFFRKYLVLFCAVWDEQMQDATLEYYFTGQITFQEMLEDLDFYNQYKSELSKINTIEELEEFCVKHGLVNLQGN